MSTDPKTFPGADPHTGQREIDPVTGYDTMGHEWAGIKELNTPFPRLAYLSLLATFIYSVIAWILLPAWPLGRDYTPGLLRLEQSEMALERLSGLTELRGEWLTRFDTPDFAPLGDDGPLMVVAMPAAHRLFQDNCAACHGMNGEGGPGFPALDDHQWLWGGDPATLAETLRVGINAPHPETRLANMPAFDWLEYSERLALADYVAALPTGGADHASPAAALFEENCTACHNERGEGGFLNGAPALNDANTIYGQDQASVMVTLNRGRNGVMPHWSDRLNNAEINLLALYVSQLPDTTQRSPQ